MQSKISLKKLSSILGIATVLSFIMVFYLSVILPSSDSDIKLVEAANNPPPQDPANDQTAIPVIIAGQVSSALPVRLKIPKIDVDAAIESVGLTVGGAMNVPKGLENVAWFNLGPRPGQVGSAVVDGHNGIWKSGEKTVFSNLSKLDPGDKVYIVDDHGTTISFTVRESRSYNPDSNASDVFASNDGKSHLNLITCGGIWNNDSESYSKRLVIFTDLKP